LHLSEFRVQAAPIRARSASEGKPVGLQNPVADFNQDGWTIAHAIDNVPSSAWGIYPQVGKPHQGGLRVQGAGEPRRRHDADIHAGTNSRRRPPDRPLAAQRNHRPRPPRFDPLPQSIKDILATAAAKRNDAQRLDLALFVLRQHVDNS